MEGAYCAARRDIFELLNGCEHYGQASSHAPTGCFAASKTVAKRIDVAKKNGLHTMFSSGDVDDRRSIDIAKKSQTGGT